MKRCPTCGLMLDDSQAFCTNDGTPLVADRAYEQQARMNVPPGPQTGWQTPPRPTSPPGYAPQQAIYGEPTQRAGKFVPALIGGAVAGVLSTFADFMSPDVYVIFSFFCILWALIGGALAAMLYIRRSPVPVRTGEGAILGLIAGAIGALIYLVVATPIAYSIHGDYIQMVANQQAEKITAGTFFALTGIAGAVTIFAFSIIGGLIGVPIFEKRKRQNAAAPPPPPPPPPGYGPPPPSGYR